MIPHRVKKCKGFFQKIYRSLTWYSTPSKMKSSRSESAADSCTKGIPLSRGFLTLYARPREKMPGLFQRLGRQRQVGAEHPPDAVAEVCRVGGAHQRRSQSPEGGAFAHVVGHGRDEGGAGGLVLGEPGALGRQDQLENAGGGRLQEVDLDAEDGVFLVVVGEAALDGHQEGIAAEEQALADGGLQADGQVIDRVALFVKKLRRLGGAAQGDGLPSRKERSCLCRGDQRS